MSKLKIAGAWLGVIELELEAWTVSMLREEVAKRSNFEKETINLICAGRVLKDGDGSQKLIELGIKNNAKVLATRVSPGQGKELIAEEEKTTRLSRLKAAATALAKRHTDGLLPVEDFNLELENQSGETVKLGSENDQRALMMGLMFHAKAKRLVKMKKYEDALEVLNMGEEAFSLCDSKVIELIDNAPILQIDMVWCYFMLQDISKLSVAGKRLEEARKGIEHAHGKESSRVRYLQGGRYPELALHLRLELLEGIVAYHSGQLEKSRKSLTAAQAKYMQLQVPDEALSLLMGMGYGEHAAKRALRMTNQNIESAVDFLVEEKERKAKKIEDDIRRRDEILEQKHYGITPLRKPVDLQRLKELIAVGFEKELAAESLRRNENDTQKALDDLTNPEINSDIQLYIESRNKKRLRQAAEDAITELTSMGFPREMATAAVRAWGTKEEALNHLLEQGGPSAPVPAGGTVHSSGSVSNNVGSTSGAVEAVDGSLLNFGETEERDVEMEDEITEELQQEDVFSDYDIELTRESEALEEYLTLLSSSVGVTAPEA